MLFDGIDSDAIFQFDCGGPDEGFHGSVGCRGICEVPLRLVRWGAGNKGERPFWIYIMLPDEHQIYLAHQLPFDAFSEPSGGEMFHLLSSSIT